MRLTLSASPLRVPALLVALASAVGLAGCADPEDPRIYPIELLLDVNGVGPGTTVDLDRDGIDEVLSYGPLGDNDFESLVIETLTRDPEGQVNISGTALQPSALDLDGDGTLEVIQPYVRDDTLWARVVDEQGEDLFAFSLFSGSPRSEPNGDILPWTLSAPVFALEDVDGDGRHELVTVASTTVARSPRGVWAHSISDGTLVDRFLIGASYRARYVRDYDRDGALDVAFGTGAPDNGAERINGLDDAHSYVGRFQLRDSLRLAWYKELGDVQTEARVFETDLDGDGRFELLASTNNRETGEGLLRLYDAASGDLIDYATARYQFAATIDTQGSPTRVLTLSSDGTVTAYDDALDPVRTLDLSHLHPQGMYSFDNVRRVGVAVTGEAGTYWLDGGLEIRAMLPDVASRFRDVRAGPDSPFMLAAKHEGRIQIYRQQPNHWWWWFRFRELLGGVLLGGILLGGSGLLWRQHRHIRQLEAVHSSASTFDETGWRLTARRVAHDLRNPLTSILLTTEQLRMAAESGAGEDAARFADRIEERIERLRRVTRNFLKFVDLEALTVSNLDLTALLHELADRLRIDLPPDITLEVHADDPVRLHADADQLVSALENLVANAVNALPKGGRIVLSTHTARGLQLRGAPAPRDWAVLEVRDSGTGIAPELRDRLFEPGVTGSSEGAGFGLAVVSKIVADHGGHAEVESEPGAGTVFTLFLPVLPDGHVALPSSDVDRPDPHG